MLSVVPGENAWWFHSHCLGYALSRWLSTASLDGSLQKQMQNLFSLFTFFLKSENPLCICVVVANESRY